MSQHLLDKIASFDLDTADQDVAPEGLTEAAWRAVFNAVATSRAMGSVGSYTEDSDGVCYYAGISGVGATYYVRLATPERDGVSGTPFDLRYPGVR